MLAIYWGELVTGLRYFHLAGTDSPIRDLVPGGGFLHTLTYSELTEPNKGPPKDEVPGKRSCTQLYLKT